MTLYLSNRDGNGKTSEEGHYKFQTAVFAGNVLGSTALLVKQNSPLGMSVLVSAGQYKIDTSSSYSYTGWNTADAVVTISTADPANPRITTIVAYVDKLASTSASPPNNPGITKLMAINGTAAASPSAPNGTTIQSAVGSGNPYIILANVTVAAAATQITNANISDQRTQVTVGSALVGSTSLVDSAVTTAKLNDLAVTTAKLGAAAVTTAKVADLAVTDQKWSNGINFYAYRSAARTISAQTFTLFAADSISWNNNSNYSNTSNAGRFTATVAGLYSFTANLFTESGTQARVIIEIRKNGTANVGRVFDTSASTAGRANGTRIYALNPGDYVEAWAWTNASMNIASQDTWFEGHIITRT